MEQGNCKAVLSLLECMELWAKLKIHMGNFIRRFRKLKLSKQLLFEIPCVAGTQEQELYCTKGKLLQNLMISCAFIQTKQKGKTNTQLVILTEQGYHETKNPFGHFFQIRLVFPQNDHKKTIISVFVR
jgi:hypothetical protein